MTTQTTTLGMMLRPAMQRNPSIRLDILERCIVQLIRVLCIRSSLAQLQHILKMQLSIQLTEDEVREIRAYAVANQPRRMSPAVAQPLLCHALQVYPQAHDLQIFHKSQAVPPPQPVLSAATYAAAC